MVTQILISENLEKRIEEIQKVLTKLEINQNHPDLLYLNDEETLGVESAKKIRQFLSFKPFQAKGRAVVLESAHNLTVDAQNSLLKTLEEPPLNSTIILGAKSDAKLLPTILSRCQILRIKNKELRIKNNNYDIENLTELSVEERFEFIEKLEEKEEFLGALVEYFRKRLKENPQNLEFTKELLDAEKWSKANVNIRAILEYLMLKLPNENV